VLNAVEEMSLIKGSAVNVFFTLTTKDTKSRCSCRKEPEDAFAVKENKRTSCILALSTLERKMTLKLISRIA